jgi:hypothetical protein
MLPSAFLRELWGDIPPGLLQIWRLRDRRSFYLHAPDVADYYAQGQTDVYTGVCAAPNGLTRSERCTEHKALAIPGMWLDIDINGGPQGKQGVAPDRARALKLAHSILPPTMIVNSGYGLQAWWLLPQPWRFRTRDEQTDARVISHQWHRLHRGQAEADGYIIDILADLSRLLRPPGTLNGKGGRQAPVTVLVEGGPRHSLEDIRELAGRAGDVPLAPARREPGVQVVDVNADANAAPPRHLFEALMANAEDFADTWQHHRPENPHWSLSEYDLALCSIAARAGWSDQHLADLIALHRRAWQPSDRKAARRDYVRRTVGRARHAQVQGAAVDHAGTLAEQLRQKVAA